MGLSVDPSEREIIEIIRRELGEDSRELLGYPDDASAVRLERRYLVVNVDVFDSTTDLLPGMTLYDVGWKSIIMSISDVAAKGARPLACLVGIGLPGLSAEEIRKLAKGLGDASKHYGVRVWGGDTGFSRHLYVSVTTIGEGEYLVSRKGARPGDVVVTTGEYGLTAAAYKILLEGLEPPSERDARVILRAAYRPSPDILKWSALLRHATASIDSSDGLAVSLHQLAERSEVRIILERVPVSEVARVAMEEWGLDPVTTAIYEGGEEYELVACIPRHSLEHALNDANSVGLEVSVIGVVTEGGGVWLKRGSELLPIERRGWVHSTSGGGWVRETADEGRHT